MSARIGGVWVIPVGAVVLDRDGDQLWYATEDGTGSVTSVGTTRKAAPAEQLGGPNEHHL